jgi:regulator of sirC expression with transglutaminase-like and TPR domain
MDLDAALDLLAREPFAALDVAEVALALARDEYPELDVAAYLCELDAMAHEARGYVRGNLRERVAGLCRYLFHEMGFRGNVQEYYDPRNSYLNDVLDRRTGIPITLSAVAMAVGTRAGLEVVGVGLPGHFIAKAVAEGRQVLFDPFHGGQPLSRRDCDNLVERVTGMPFRATRADLAPVPLGLLVARMLNNLKGVYLREGNFGRAVRVIGRLRQLSPDDAVQRRDLGLALLKMGQPGPAIDHLESYLENTPEGEEQATVRRLLEQAQSEIARWN